ncbi:MAG TPA: glycosyl hydrolase [Polyangiaceae bacterium]
MPLVRHVVLALSTSVLLACGAASPSQGQGGTDNDTTGGAGSPSSPVGHGQQGGGGTSEPALPPAAGRLPHAGGTPSGPPATPYTLTVTSPKPNASVSGTVDVVGLGPGFLNLEVHSSAGALLARVTPDAAGHFSAPVDTTKLASGAAILAVDAWDAAAGAPFQHHASTSLPLAVTNASAPTGCVDAQGNGIRYFGAYTKNTQTNYDFDTWAGFHQDFLTSFMSCDTWADAASSDWGFDIMSQQPAGENIQEIVCLTTTEDTSLQHVAAGMYDSYFQQMGQLFIKHGYPNGFIRVGHEFDGTWYPWAINGGTNNMDYAGFIAAFRHVAGILKAISPSFTIVWNPGCGYYAQSMDDEKAYPGDDVVDVIGIDCYDDGSGVDHIFNGVYGLNQWAQFAQQHGKPIALPEWGLMNGGDDPAYIQAMFNFMTANPTFLESFWDSDDGSTHSQITTGEDPMSGAMFLQTFGQYAKACHP